jgi:hypothetical protein
MPQSILFENPITKEQWLCDNIKSIKVIEGIEFITVRKKDTIRTVLMRKDILKKVKKQHV